MDDEMDVFSLPRSSNPSLSVVVPDTIPSNPPKAERWVLYRNPYAQERADLSGNKRDDESSAANPASEAESPPMSHRNNSSDKHVTVKREEESSSAAYPNASGTDETTNSVEADESSDPMETNEESAKPLRSFEIPEEIDIELRLARIKAEARAYALSGPTAQKRTKKRQRPPSGRERYLAAMDQNWMVMYKRLVKYKKKCGNTCVPGKWKDPKLANWVGTQRSDYSKSKLSQNRIKLLKSIGFVWNQLEEQWMEMYQRLVNYKKKYGHTCVPGKWEEDRKLGTWVYMQRKHYSKSKISENRIKLLKSIGFVWGQLEEQWMEMYQRLVNYRKKYGSTCVPQDWKEDPKLASWVNNQRQRYSKETLSQNRIELLKSIGFVWDRREDQWMEMYQSLVNYQKKHGHTCVPATYDKKLAKWVYFQRKDYLTSKSSSLSQNRIKLLESIGFVW